MCRTGQASCRTLHDQLFRPIFRSGHHLSQLEPTFSTYFLPRNELGQSVMMRHMSSGSLIVTSKSRGNLQVYACMHMLEMDQSFACSQSAGSMLGTPLAMPAGSRVFGAIIVADRARGPNPFPRLSQLCALIHMVPPGCYTNLY